MFILECFRWMLLPFLLHLFMPFAFDSHSRQLFVCVFCVAHVSVARD